MSIDGLSDNDIAEILARVRTIAVVGASNNPDRPSYGVMQFLIARGYTVHPVNPGLAGKEILGRHVYAKLTDVPGPVDMVDIFRNSDAARGVVQDAIAAKDKLSISVVWMQLGVIHQQAADSARAAGLEAVMDRCPAIELHRLDRT
jgi:uncharacterized protein